MTAEEIFEELLSMTKYRGLTFTVGRRLWNRKKTQYTLSIFYKNLYVVHSYFVVENDLEVSRSVDTGYTLFDSIFGEERVDEVRDIVRKWNGK
ncbi:hypothetical protein [Streptococcus constellatus]|uniref:hypothetical protein n=1 Tax=Streptococcus constellatus TaxID=76860 RepID=UPI00189740EB|nr:hypothetical protein [Streptococcus constellatus]